jgi:hypothetical protein
MFGGQTGSGVAANEHELMCLLKRIVCVYRNLLDVLRLHKELNR